MSVYGQWKQIKIVFIMEKSPKIDADTIQLETTFSIFLRNIDTTNIC